MKFEEANSQQQTAIGSSNVPKTPDKPAEFQTESGGSRRGRGRTLLKDLYNLNPVERVRVSKNIHGQPVGFEARLLVGYMGIIARNANMLPINYKSWHHMPDSNKNQALDNIKERFALEVSDAYIKKALGKRWRDHKSTLKKEYFKKRYKPRRKIAKCPARNVEELSSGQKVGRLQLFDITHRKKDGSPMTFEAGEITEKLKDKKAEYEAIASTDSYVNLEDIDNRIITEVLSPERYGRVRFQGSGVNPTQYFGSSSQQYMPSGSQAQAEVQRLRDQMAQIQESTVEQIAQLKAEAALREAEVQKNMKNSSNNLERMQQQGRQRK
ncbi:hypothetical protein J1N35_022827 [Gossypium stocksii]|uniref:Transposase n=1 Tax=Gossypium stocksii TaxID=47602 RepID=A0A9D3VHH2_9ROSI|nr:hypothetical protein J1N35_022827 [Gossypium stocksii]